MAAHALTLGSPTAFEPLRHQMAQHLKIYPTPTRSLIGKSVGKVPKVLYVDRQDTSRRLDPEAHQHLMELFEGMRDEGKVVFTHGVFGEGMTVEEQIQSVIAADVSPSISHVCTYIPLLTGGPMPSRSSILLCLSYSTLRAWCASESS